MRLIAISCMALIAARTVSAQTWEASIEAQIRSQIEIMQRTARPHRHHRRLGGNEDGSHEDYIQRVARELMKTVRPAKDWRAGEPIGQFIDTYYFNVLEADYAGPQTVAVKDGKGGLIANVREGFWRHFKVEGSGRILDGREINTSEGGVIVVEYPLGEGNCPLRPWHTIAVDHRVIPLGTIVKIDETVGLALPDGTVSDGVWQAEDTGGAVRNAHIDLYVGDGERAGQLVESSGIHLKPLTVRFVDFPPKTCALP